ncbi:SIMPL domain-containing protein [Patescibacteria group bacterium]|nr:SIMPL domain-containing protein [Patescibacteria group bacterium]
MPPKPPAPPVNTAKRVLDLVTLVVIVGLIIGIIAVARGGSSNTPSLVNQQGLTVTGEGMAYVTPDVAKIDFGISTEAKNLADSQKLNSESIARIKDALQTYSIEAKDIKTLYYTINPEYNYILNGRSPQLRGYTTRHTVRITVRKLEDADSVVQTLGNSGATEISQVQFTVDDPSDVQKEAREKAIDAAKEKATQLAKLSGASLGRIISINENTPNIDGGIVPRFSEGMGGGGIMPGLEEGSMSITSNVTITYSLN